MAFDKKATLAPRISTFLLFIYLFICIKHAGNIYDQYVHGHKGEEKDINLGPFCFQVPIYSYPYSVTRLSVNRSRHH